MKECVLCKCWSVKSCHYKVWIVLITRVMPAISNYGGTWRLPEPEEVQFSLTERERACSQTVVVISLAPTNIVPSSSLLGPDCYCIHCQHWQDCWQPNIGRPRPGPGPGPGPFMSGAQWKSSQGRRGGPDRDGVASPGAQSAVCRQQQSVVSPPVLQGEISDVSAEQNVKCK